MIEGARRAGSWLRPFPVALAVLLLLGWVTRSRAAEPEAPSKDFLEYLGTLEAEGGDWTIFDSSPTAPQESPRPPKKEKAPAPQPEDEP